MPSDNDGTIRYIAPLKISKSDFRRVWEACVYSAHAKRSWKATIYKLVRLLGIAAAAVACAAYCSSNAASSGLIILGLVAGFWLLSVVWHLGSEARKNRLFEGEWRSLSNLPSDLKLFETDEGLRWVGTNYSQDLAWIDIKWMITRRGLWIAASKSGWLFWMPESSFRDLFHFDHFAHWARRTFDARSQMAKGFEVVLPDETRKPDFTAQTPL